MRYAIGLPSYLPHDARNVGPLMSLAAALGAEQISFDVIAVGQDPDFCHAFNTILSRFGNSRSDRLIVIDSDMVFQPQDALKLLRSDKDVVGADYPRKAMGHGNVARPTEPYERRDDCLSVDLIGTGFLCISRSAFHRMAAVSPVLIDGGGYHSQIAWAGAHEARWVDGAEGFCLTWQKVGGTVWCDTSIKLGHIGSYEYREAMG